MCIENPICFFGRWSSENGQLCVLKEWWINSTERVTVAVLRLLRDLRYYIDRFTVLFHRVTAIFLSSLPLPQNGERETAASFLYLTPVQSGIKSETAPSSSSNLSAKSKDAGTNTVGTFQVKSGLAQMLKVCLFQCAPPGNSHSGHQGGVIMDVVNAEQVSSMVCHPSYAQIESCAGTYCRRSWRMCCHGFGTRSC